MQGDGIAKVLIPDYESKQCREAKVLLISNTCDADSRNQRLYVPYLSFAPIFSLKSYENALLEKYNIEKVRTHIEAIRHQKITSFFFLSSNEADIQEDCFVGFDCIASMPTDKKIIEKLVKQRLFALSDYGFFLLLFKLSIHFTRIQEAVNR